MTPEQETLEAMPASPKELTAHIRSICKEELEADGKEILDLDQIRKTLSDLTWGEADRELEVAISGFADKWAPSIISGDDALLPKLFPKDGEHPEYGTTEEWIAFTAFAVAVNYERLQKNPDQEGVLLQKYEKFFGRKLPGSQTEYEHTYFFHLDVLHRMDKVVSRSSDREFLETLLRDAEQNSKNMNNNRGGDHAFAETVALVFENTTPELRKYFEASPDNWLEKAARAASEALKIDYAKFYCTRGRIHALRGELKEAIADVNTAIAKEKNTRKDYSIRIGQYTSYYQQFRAQQNLLEQQLNFEKTVAEVTQQIQAREDEIAQQIKVQENEVAQRMKDQEADFVSRMETQEKETMAKNMEFLGLFSGIVSFTIGSLTLASNFTSEDAMKIAGLIVILMGALMCVFSAFGVILHGVFGTIKDRKTGEPKHGFIGRHLTVFVAGLLVVVGGILLCIFF